MYVCSFLIIIIIISYRNKRHKMIDPWLPPIDNILQPVVKIPLQFDFQPVEILSKQLTKLNSTSPYRIHYLGPRWDNSVAMHTKLAAKHGYEFNKKLLNHSSNFLSETMSHNQFYRNQVFYRAFEGMNPTLNKQQQLSFNSNFQSGNLDCVVKVGPEQYDLFLRVDSNTKGHLFWFYFQVSKGQPGSTIKLNICNMTKCIGLYQNGLKPYSCTSEPDGTFPANKWSQNKCQVLGIQTKKLRYEFIYDKIKVRNMYELTFSYEFDGSGLPVRFAYCVPYTYTDMLRDLKCLADNAEVKNVGRSMTGLNIPVVRIENKKNKHQNIAQQSQKPVLLMIGRLHPGETCGSHVLAGFMKYLATSPEAEEIRNKLITIVVPMINPDGVVLGNSRTGALGKDLNRQFKSKNKLIFPQVHLVKNLVQRISSTHNIEMFLDFHGHSRKKNMFMFGPNYNITQPEYYRSRVMPKYLSQLTQIFRYFGCDYRLPPGKLSTARGVMLNQYKIPYVFTIETSVGRYFDHEGMKDMGFVVKKWEELGVNIFKAVKQYFQSVLQYEEFVRSRQQQANSKKLQTPSLKPPNSDREKATVPIPGSAASPTRKKSIFTIKDLKLIKLFQEIKASEQKKQQKGQKGEQQGGSGDDSDSECEDDNLEKKKRSEFEGMVSECVQAQKKRQQMHQRQIEQNLPKQKRLQTQGIRKLQTRRNKITRERQDNDMSFLKNFMANFLEKPHSAIKVPPNKRKQMRHASFEQKRPDNISVDKSAAYPEIICHNAYFDSEFPTDLDFKRKREKNSIRMFNFSKAIEETDPKLTSTTCRATRKNIQRGGEDESRIQTRDFQTFPQPTKQSKFARYIKVNLEATVQGSIGNNQTQQLLSPKKKSNYPAPFYRIKYQNHQRKKQRYQDAAQIEIEISKSIKQVSKSNNKIQFLNIRTIKNK